MAKIEVPGFKCERCGHIWRPRNETDEPRVCPKCKSPYWNKPRKVAKDKNEAKKITESPPKIAI